MTVITSTMLMNYPEFSRRLAIEREAQIAALALREAEERAIRTQQAGGTFFTPFGVHFDLASPKEYVLFADTKRSTTIPAGESDFYDSGEALETMVMGRDVRVKDICQHEKNVPANCDIDSLSIVFYRPAPLIKVNGKTSGNPPVDLGVPDFEIHVGTEEPDNEQTIVVWTTGAISIED